MLRHILFIRFKSGVGEAELAHLAIALDQLKQQIPGISDIEFAENNSPEGKSGGFTHVIQMTFVDAEARDHYLPHPQHDQFKRLFRPLLADILVMDYSLPAT